MKEKTETFSIRLKPSLAKEIDKLSKRKLETKSNIFRKALLQYLEREMGKKEIKKLAAKKYTEGTISFEDLIKVVGYEDAKKIAFFVDVAKKSFGEGLE